MLGVSVDDKPSKVGSIGGRRLSTPPSSWRAQASPTRPEQPSLASVGGAGAAWPLVPHSRTASRAADARVRPIFLDFAQTVTQMCHIFTRNEPRAVYIADTHVRC